MQFSKVHTAPCHRYFSLLIRGESRAGKTALAKSLWGAEHTLVVNCQGCTPHLPSIADFDRDEHMAITWDEIDEQQVLQNEVVFQAGASVVTLGQSKCNQYSYGSFLHGVPMILCSNTFVLPGKGRQTHLPAMDAAWLEKNVVEVALPHGEVWYQDDEMPGANKEESLVSTHEPSECWTGSDMGSLEASCNMVLPFA